MSFKIVVAGSRDYCDYKKAKEYINLCICGIENKDTVIFLSGGCRGADMLGERYAIENGYDIKKYPADWKKYGAAAGPIRNREMAKEADMIICFWDGLSKGTKSLIDYAIKFEKNIKIKMI